MLRRSKTDEERQAAEAEKAQRREADALRKAAAAERSRIDRETKERENLRTAFERSPAGQARVAFGRGQRVFQFVIDVKDTKPVVVPLGPATTASTTTDPVAILNSVCDEGWDLVNGSFVFHELGSESRDKFLATGQKVAVRGTVVGYYLFRRSPENKRAEQDPWDRPTTERPCPHCGGPAEAQSRICPGCGRESASWQLKDGRWSQLVNGQWHTLDERTGTWINVSTSESPISPTPPTAAPESHRA